jgi:hypothetical protein
VVYPVYLTVEECVSIADYSSIIHRKDAAHKPKAPDFSRAFGLKWWR